MDISMLLNAIVEAKSPIITGAIVVLGMIINNKGILESFKNDVREKVKGDTKELLEGINKMLVNHESYLKASETRFKEVLGKIEKQTEMIKSHDRLVSVYSDTDCFKKEIRETVNHSLEILTGEDKLLSAEYLYCISNQVCEIIDIIALKGITTLSRLDLDAYTANAIKECKDKFNHIYGSDKGKVYWKNNNVVHSLKLELFALLDDTKVNNIERRYRTLTIKWFEELCANFIRKMYLKEN